MELIPDRGRQGRRGRPDGDGVRTSGRYCFRFSIDHPEIDTLLLLYGGSRWHPHRFSPHNTSRRTRWPASSDSSTPPPVRIDLEGQRGRRRTRGEDTHVSCARRPAADLPAACLPGLDYSSSGLSSMADPELEAIRQRRMQELMAQRGGANQQNAGQQKAQEDAKQEAEERRQMMLAQILSSEARERLSRIALVKPDKARGVEDVLLRAAQSGGISEKVSEEKLISLLEQINTHTSKQTKVTIQRRRSVLDDDD